MSRSIRHLPIRYGIALLGVALTWMALRSPALGYEPGSRTVLYFLAILVGAWYGGLGSGLLVTALITLLSVLESFPTWRPMRPDLFVAAGVLVSALVETLHASRRRAEAEAEARQISEERYRLLFEANPHPMWVFDAETLAFLAVNEAAIAHYGYTHAEFLAMTAADIRPPEDVPKLRESVASHRADGFYNDGHWRHRRKDGTLIDVEISAHRLTFRDRPAWVVLVNDVTERQRAEDALRFLSEASAVLASSLDYEVTLSGVAHLAVPQFADLCVIRILDEEGTLRPLAVAQTDPRKVEMTRELYHRYRPDAEHPLSPAHVLRTRRPDFLPKIPAAMVWGQDHDSDPLKMLRDLGFRSYICAPLVAHGRTLGMISLLAAESGIRYTPADLALVEDLAHRIALAVDNAKRYQEARQASRSKDEAMAMLDTLFATAPVGLAYLDRDLRFVRVNATLAAINGPSPEAHLGRTIPEILPELGAPLERILQRILQTGHPVLNREINGETPALPGVRRNWLASFYPLRTPADEVLGVGVAVMEITEQKRVEEALVWQARQAALRADVSAAFNPGDLPLTEALHVCVRAVVRHLEAALARIWTIDPDAPLPRLQASAGMYGAQSRVPLGAPLIGRIAEQRRPHLTNDLQHDPHFDDPAWAGREGIVAFAGHPLLVEDRLVGVIAMFAGQPLPKDTLDALSFVANAIAQGIHRRLLEEERDDSLNRAQAARAEAEAANRAKDRFLAVLSHELRTPLTPVLVATSALLDEGAAPEIRPTLEMIRRNVELEARLIDDLLDVSLLARGGLRLEDEIVEVHEAIHRAVEICQAEIDAAHLDVVLDLAATASHVHGDRARLLQITWNLIRNAAKFTPDGGTLTIRSRGHDAAGGLQVEFRDTGIGIEPEALSRIFEPFEQGNSGRRGRSSGLGLGLTISRTLAEAHGGRLTAESPGSHRGSTFLLELPTVPAPAAAHRAPEAPAVASNGSPHALKILLLEDNKDTLRFLALVLRKRGHEVTEAASLAAARAAATAAPFDLLLSDIELPDGTGLELMAEWGRRRGVPGIAMSGFGSEEDIRLSQAAGFAAHLTKPVDVRRLEEAILKILPASG